MAAPHFHGRQTVVTPGKPVRITDTPRMCVFARFSALEANTGSCAVGGPWVSALDGNYNTKRITIDVDMVIDFTSEGKSFDLSELYLDAEVANEGVTFEVY